VTAKFLKYLALFLVVAISGIPYFILQRSFIILSFLLSLALLIYYEKKIEGNYYAIIALFIGIEIIQDIYFGNINLYMHLSTFLRISTVYFLLRVLGFNFFYMYTRLIVFFSIISWIFFIGDTFFNFRELFIPKVTNLFSLFEKSSSAYPYSPNIILYTFNPNTINFTGIINNRNSGPFYEPGAFAIFIIIAFIFNLLLNKKLADKTNIILSITLFSTFSTTGYTAFFAILTAFIFIKSNLKYKYFILIFVLIGVYYAYFSIPFLYEKVEYNINIAEETTASRFGSAIADFKKIKEHPIIGYGKNIKNIYHKDKFEIELMHRNNGLTKLMVNYGILIFLFFIFQIYNTFYLLSKPDKMSAFIIFLALLISGFSQTIFNYPLLYAFLFLPEVIKTQLKQSNIKNES